jgi:hypothetical protein
MEIAEIFSVSVIDKNCLLNLKEKENTSMISEPPHTLKPRKKRQKKKKKKKFKKKLKERKANQISDGINKTGCEDVNTRKIDGEEGGAVRNDGRYHKGVFAL